MKKVKKLTWIFFVVIIFFLIAHVVFFLCDIIPWCNNRIMSLKESVSFMDFNLQDKSEALLGAYGTVWAISVGVIVFIVQRGYGPVMGLSIIDILILMLHPVSLFLLTGYFIFKFPLYILAYCYHWKCTLAWGMAESFLSLAFVISSFGKLLDMEMISFLLKRNTTVNMRGSRHSIKTDKWMLVKSVRNLNYNSSEECSELVHQLTLFLKEIKIPQNMLTYEAAEQLIWKADILKTIMENICFTVEGKERLEYIIKQCVHNLKNEDIDAEDCVKKYLLLQTVLDMPADIEAEKMVISVLEMSGEKDASELLAYLMYYLIIVLEVKREKVWGRKFLHDLWKYVKDAGLEEKTYTFLKKSTQTAPGYRVIYLEYTRDMSGGLSRINVNNLTQLGYERVILEEAIRKEGYRCIQIR